MARRLSWLGIDVLVASWCTPVVPRKSSCSSSCDCHCWIIPIACTELASAIDVDLVAQAFGG